MRKSTILLLLSVVFAHFASYAAPAKSDSTGKVYHELSLNSTFFIKQFLNFSNSNLEVSPYILNYKLITSKRNALRIGLGMNYSYEEDPIEDIDAKEQSQSIDIDYRIGWEKRFDIGEKWLVFAGVDAFHSIMKNETITIANNNNLPQGFTETRLNDVNMSFGAGPVLGIQLKISERVSLFTESSLLLTQSFIKSEIERTNSTLEDETDKSRRTNISFVIPTSLFFAVKF